MSNLISNGDHLQLLVRLEYACGWPGALPRPFAEHSVLVHDLRRRSEKLKQQEEAKRQTCFDPVLPLRARIRSFRERFIVGSMRSARAWCFRPTLLYAFLLKRSCLEEAKLWRAALQKLQGEAAVKAQERNHDTPACG